MARSAAYDGANPAEATPSSRGLRFEPGTARRYRPQCDATFVTSDFDAAHAELLANGVEFDIYDIEEKLRARTGTTFVIDQPHMRHLE